jgi:hypothetical protein
MVWVVLRGGLLQRIVGGAVWCGAVRMVAHLPRANRPQTKPQDRSCSGERKLLVCACKLLDRCAESLQASYKETDRTIEQMNCTVEMLHDFHVGSGSEERAHKSRCLRV